jgi:predicted MFS family arabinose efflux permease
MSVNTSANDGTVKPVLQPVQSWRNAPIYWLALGAFAVGTEAFMISAILPDIASSLSVSYQAAGLLVAIFSFTYALTSPVLTALTSAIGRRGLLMWSMTAFAGANVIAAAAPDYWSLVGARILLAMTAGLYVPSANALAGALAPPERRGRALAIVTGGISVAVALGVPTGAFVGTRFGWRMTFVCVAVVSAVALAGLLVGLPRGIGAGLPTASLRERLTVVRLPGVLSALLVTTLWATGAYTLYTYIAPYLMEVLGLRGAHVGYVLFLYGFAALTGLLFGGAASDRFGARRVISAKLPLMALALVTLSLWAHYLTLTHAMVPVLISVFIWGFTAWGFFPAQQTRLIGITGIKVAPIILSLNASFMYLGFSLGAALGSFTLTRGGVSDLGWVAALCVLGSLGLFFLTHRHAGASTA